ncbi:MAG: hypothetical protein K0S32_1820 [Bacteroidetes bacterium]|jgi:hypothetical protein|nr:hypothetical protein [Bacteroidota bacterium]
MVLYSLLSCLLEYDAKLKNKNSGNPPDFR